VIAGGATLHLAHPLGIAGYENRRVKDDMCGATLLADLLRMLRLPEAWVARPCLLRGIRRVQLGSPPSRRHSKKQTSTGPMNGPRPAALVAATLKAPQPKPGASMSRARIAGPTTISVNQVAVS
jgi:hypothetical protein